MEFTKDIAYNVRYSRNLNTLNLKRKKRKGRLIGKIIGFIKDNKFISIVLIGTIILTIVDMILVNAFMNLFTTL